MELFSNVCNDDTLKGKNMMGVQFTKKNKDPHTLEPLHAK